MLQYIQLISNDNSTPKTRSHTSITYLPSNYYGFVPLPSQRRVKVLATRPWPVLRLGAIRSTSRSSLCRCVVAAVFCFCTRPGPVSLRVHPHGRNRSPSVWARRKTFVVPKKPAEPVVVAGPAEPEQLVRHRAQRHPPRADVDSESQWDPEANRPPTPTALKFPFPAPSSAGRSSLQRLDGSSRGSSRLEPRASRAECASRGGRGAC